ncbi:MULTISPECIES: polyprenyl synthetase [unclassified Streptomyces]|uniref:polyprenyl synthetase n=1 Tax=unclassified Streptomyces TaxID=2593676 RepID=UPI001F101B71|nr:MULTISPECIES: polyprenyl synthetase [unclassified Streptomyces]
MTHPTPPGERPDEKALLMAAGLADLVVETIGTAAGSLRSLLGRADSADLAQDAAADLRARGRLALDRLAADRDGPRSVPHMELLAREAAARRAAAQAPAADPDTRQARQVRTEAAPDA